MSAISHPQTPRRLFTWLSVITCCAVYLLIVVGGVVRVSDSGLGCPDWPLCYGSLIPPAVAHSLIEMSHRYTAAVTGVLIVATIVMTWRYYRNNSTITRLSAGVLPLLAGQITLGGMVVVSELEPLLVAVHLGIALLIFAALLVITTSARQSEARAELPASYTRLIVITVGALFALLITGKLVLANQAYFACVDWPLCDGAILPAGAGVKMLIHLLHRYAAAGVGVLVALTVWQTLNQPAQTRAAKIVAGLLGTAFVVQVGIGAAQVLTRMPPVLRGAHLAVASAAWALLVVLAAMSVSGGQPRRSGSG